MIKQNLSLVLIRPYSMAVKSGWNFYCNIQVIKTVCFENWRDNFFPFFVQSRKKKFLIYHLRCRSHFCELSVVHLWLLKLWKKEGQPDNFFCWKFYLARTKNPFFPLLPFGGLLVNGYPFVWPHTVGKLQKNVAFQFLNFGIFHQFLSWWNWHVW